MTNFCLPHKLSLASTLAIKTFIAEIESDGISISDAEKAQRIDALVLLYTIMDILIQLAFGKVTPTYLEGFHLSILCATGEPVQYDKRYGQKETIRRARENVYMDTQTWEATLPLGFWVEATRNERLYDILLEDRKTNILLFEKAASFFK